jgi:hypothetical protein
MLVELGHNYSRGMHSRTPGESHIRCEDWDCDLGILDCSSSSSSSIVLGFELFA